MTLQRLDNIAWHTLTGPHARYAAGTNEARRYAPGFSPIVAFANLDRPDFASLRSHCEPGEHFYCGGWSGAVPTGWRIDAETIMHQMVWDAPVPVADDAFEAVRLGSEHVAQMLALCAGALREISGVCTEPDFQGQGLARRLVAELIRHQMRRREIPFLHVMCDNANARRIYERMGFRDHRETVIRVLARSQ